MLGKINQGMHDFFKNVAGPLCSQLLKGMSKVSIIVADSYLQAIKKMTIQLCNNLLVAIQQRPPLPEDPYFGLYSDLSAADKACAFSLASLSDHDACVLLNEMLFIRVKTEDYYRQLSEKLRTAEDRHTLRKPIAEVQMKTIQAIATLKEGLTAHLVGRLETTCL